MQRYLQSRTTRRVALVSVAVIIMIAAAVGVTIWRYEAARSASHSALHTSIDANRTTELVAAFWHERGSMSEYLLAASPEELAETGVALREFNQVAAAITPDEPVIAHALHQVLAAHARFRALFLRLRGSGGTNVVRESHALEALDAAEPAALRGLTRMRNLQHQVEAAAEASADAAATQARVTGIAAAVLAVLAGITAAFFVLRLLEQSLRREAALAESVEQLNSFLARLRTTSAVLGEVSGELRMAAKDAATATRQQSAAVTETSATIEQLATTAGSIADTVDEVAEAAERTGATMQDMRQQVEAISLRAQSLGERAHKIDEILELINGIAGQTNLLALNAAIEAARAGDAGKGFAVVAAEVRKLAERSLDSTESISEILAGVRDETNATIMATEQGARQVREVGELMSHTVTKLEQSIVAVQQQKSAAGQVDGAVVQIRDAAGQLAAEQAKRASTAERLDAMVDEIEAALRDRAAAPVPQVNGGVLR
jgi:methyl-accepting chemotaxis protein